MSITTLSCDPTPHIYVKQTTTKGKGLFAKQFIPKGTLIGNYNGRLILREEATNLSPYAMCHINHVLEPCDGNGQLLEHDNPVYFINEPSPGEQANCFSLTLMYFDSTIPLKPPYVQIWTCKDVMKDDELLFSYGEDYPRDYAINMEVAQNNCYTYYRMDKKDLRIMDLNHPLGVEVSVSKENPFKDKNHMAYHVYQTLQNLLKNS